MLSEGADAPGFELPALVDGEKRRVALDEYLGNDVVILAFYPGDFNPACDEESCDLDELDLFTMQKDVTILGISPDSVYSHGAFARQYDLNVPLLSDTDGEVAQRYDIGLVDDIGQSLVERAVAVVDHDGTVTYSWSTEDMTELPEVEAIKDALAETGGDDTAFARYRVGHAHYTEGRRSFTSAMESFQNTEWVMAQHDFQQACDEFEAAADRFDTALRFVDDESLVPIYEGANEKATALWQAADWLTRSASAYSSGSGTKGQELRDDADIPLSTVREYREPPDPDGEWPPEMATLAQAETDDHSILPTEPDVEDAALEVDIDEAATDDEATAAGPTSDEPDDDDTAAVTGDGGADPVVDDVVESTAGDGADPAASAGTEPAADDGTETAADDGTETAADDDFDDEELAEIQAELAANNPDSEPSVDELTEESTAIVEAPPMGETDDEPETPETADDTAETSEAADGAPAESTAPADASTDEPAQAPEPVDGPAAEPGEEPAAGAADGTLDKADATGPETPDGPMTEDAGDGPVDSSDGATPGTAADGRDDSGAGESEDTDADDSEDTDASRGDEVDADEGGPDLQLELAEPDPDPLDADGPPIPSADDSDEALASSEQGESDGESSADE